ncbi:MAG: caspase family protein [Saprospiraceae bacterium]
MRQITLLPLFFYYLLFCLPVFAQIQPIIPKTTTRAVVVGISNYQNISKLRFAHKDAEAFVQFLRSPAGGSLAEEHIKFLTNENATQAQIGNALSWLNAESQANDCAIIYFSGHGDVETQFTNMGYLLAYDANKSTYMAGGAIPIYALQSVITNLSVVKLVKVLLIADACRSGNLAGTETGGTKTTALAMATQFAKEIKIMSCGPDEVSLEGEDWGGGRSVFSYYLIDGMRGLADFNDDRQVTLREIGRFLEDSVEMATRALRLQSPRTGGDEKMVVAQVDPATIAALRRKNNPQKVEPTIAVAAKTAQDGPTDSDSSTMRLYRDFEEALRKGHLTTPEKDAAYTIYQLIKDRPALRTYKNGMRNDLATAMQVEAQKAINDYLSADPREMRRRWGLDDSRYRLYPQYLEKAAELLGESYHSYTQIKAREHYFAGLNLRLQGERPGNTSIRDSLFRIAKGLQEKTLQLDSTAAYAYNELGLLARRFKQYEQSVAYFNRAVRFSPTWVLPWANLCGSYNESGQTEAAERSGLKAISIDSTCALAHYNLGDVYWIKKETEKEAYHFQKTLEFSPDYANAYFNLGLIKFHKGAYIEAEGMFQEFIKLVPKDPDGYQNLGEVYMKLSKFGEAEAQLLKAIELNPDFAKSYLSLSELYLFDNKPEKSEMWFKKFSAMRPEDPEGYFYLALKSSPNNSQSLRHLETALQKGFKDYNRIQSENRLAVLRDTPEFKKLIKKYFPDK